MNKDAYRKILGIDVVGDAPPDYYTILGVKRFESDPEKILHAILDQKERVSHWQIRSDVQEDALELMRLLGQISVELLNQPEDKRKYDLDLAKTLNIKIAVPSVSQYSMDVEKLKISCPSCHASLFKTDRSCPHCGHEFSVPGAEQSDGSFTSKDVATSARPPAKKVALARKDCPACGASVLKNDTVCQSCGYSFAKKAVAGEGKGKGKGQQAGLAVQGQSAGSKPRIASPKPDNSGTAETRSSVSAGKSRPLSRYVFVAAAGVVLLGALAGLGLLAWTFLMGDADQPADRLVNAGNASDSALWRKAMSESASLAYLQKSCEGKTLFKIRTTITKNEQDPDKKDISIVLELSGNTEGPGNSQTASAKGISEGDLNGKMRDLLNSSSTRALSHLIREGRIPFKPILKMIDNPIARRLFLSGVIDLPGTADLFIETLGDSRLSEHEKTGILVMVMGNPYSMQDATRAEQLNEKIQSSSRIEPRIKQLARSRMAMRERMMSRSRPEMPNSRAPLLQRRREMMLAQALNMHFSPGRTSTGSVMNSHGPQFMRPVRSRPSRSFGRPPGGLSHTETSPYSGSNRRR